MFFTGLRSFPPGKHLLGYSVTLVPGSVSAHTSLPSFCTAVYAHSVIILSSKVTDLIQHPPTLPLLHALQQLHHFSAWLENKAHHLRDDENGDTVTRIKQQAFEPICCSLPKSSSKQICPPSLQPHTCYK